MNPALLAACKLASAASFAQGRWGLQGWFTLPDVMDFAPSGLIGYDKGIAQLDALVKTGHLRRATWDEAVGLSSAALYRLVEVTQ
jgi:hypothetical protein